MTIGYYPGCSLHGTGREYDESVRAVAGALGLTLREIDDWSCCGATSAHSVNPLLAVVLPARNLALAESAGMTDVLTPCAACYNRLARSEHAVATNPELAEKMPRLLGRPFSNSVHVRTVLDVLRESLPVIKEKTVQPLKGMKVACYYGCLLLRPAEIAGGDDPESPTFMEEIVKAIGAEPVTWNLRMDCCGGSMSIPHAESVVRLSRAILEDARSAGAEALVVACPMCHSNLDFRQQAYTNKGETTLPVLYLTELLGLALGLNAESLGLKRHFVSPAPMLERMAVAAKEAV
ncbi:MAG: heterodisulfide reductase subunit B [Armatimonadetes bacterium]|nr:heterodisulfide reductase subunit B [Armatimonadota bacterium]